MGFVMSLYLSHQQYPILFAQTCLSEYLVAEYALCRGTVHADPLYADDVIPRSWTIKICGKLINSKEQVSGI